VFLFKNKQCVVRSDELVTTLPGATSLSIELVDWQANPLALHELIGATTIDLEDRWFNSR
jgi:hypothetical protein